MNRRATGAFALQLLIVLASLLEAAGLDHQCVRDEQPAPVAAVFDGLSPQLSHGDEPDDHDCPCCQAQGSRILLEPPSEVWRLPLLDRAEPASEARNFPRLLLDGVSNRGPPIH